MHVSTRRTLVVPDRLALRAHRLLAARTHQHGLQVMTIDQLAARLAGGFARPIDADSLRVAIQAVLPITPLGELDAIKSLPGMVNAAARTLGKVWHAGIDLQARADVHPRLAALARLEQAVLQYLPAGMERPAALAAAAIARLAHAPAVLGSVDFDGMSAVAPCWHALVLALAHQVTVRWHAGPRAAPTWLTGGDVGVVRAMPVVPAVSVVSAATPAHEALEALRWARALLASRRALPHEIAFAAADPARFDAHLLALSDEAGIDLHFVHGVPVTTTRDGQAVAALADALVGGLSQLRLRRIATLCADAAPLRALPVGWQRVLPAGAALASPQAWERLLARITPAHWPKGTDSVTALAALVALVALLQQGADAAEEVGAQLLRGRALSLWRRALVAGPAASLLATIERMKQDDGHDPCTTLTWMPASALAGTPRRFVRLLGLNAGQWPRASAEDALLPDHVVAADELEPLGCAVQDSRDFDHVLQTSAAEVVLSFSRRNDDGRCLGKSPLLAGQAEPAYLLRHDVPTSAMSEPDRLAARLPEFRQTALAQAAATCWNHWQGSAVTAHDGVVRPDHPMLQAIADRTHSASSLKRLLRNPIGYMWEYGLGWTGPELLAEQLMLDPAAFGNLVHAIADLALQRLELGAGLATADLTQVGTALEAASDAVAAQWASEIELPPAAIWRQALGHARQLGLVALTQGRQLSDGSRAYGEVPFGAARPKSAAQQPWDSAQPVTIAIEGGALRISGYIDRLDMSPDRNNVLVRDYKTGKPVSENAVLDGGAEVQRCLYAYAAKAMLGQHVHVRTTLMYLRDETERDLPDPEAAMAELAVYLGSAYRSLVAGRCLPGPDTGSAYDKFAFLLPANAQGAYCKRKSAAIKTALGDAANVWKSH